MKDDKLKAQDGRRVGVIGMLGKSSPFVIVDDLTDSQRDGESFTMTLAFEQDRETVIERLYQIFGCQGTPIHDLPAILKDSGVQSYQVTPAKSISRSDRKCCWKMYRKACTYLRNTRTYDSPGWPFTEQQIEKRARMLMIRDACRSHLGKPYRPWN